MFGHHPTCRNCPYFDPWKLKYCLQRDFVLLIQHRFLVGLKILPKYAAAFFFTHFVLLRCGLPLEFSDTKSLLGHKPMRLVEATVTRNIRLHEIVHGRTHLA